MDDNLWHFDSELSDSNIYVYTIEIPEGEQPEQFVDLVDIQNVTEVQEIPPDWRQMGEINGQADDTADDSPRLSRRLR